MMAMSLNLGSTSKGLHKQQLRDRPRYRSASIIALAEDGVRIFGSGGATVNEAILRTNKSLGYIVEEHWLSYQLS